jgi:hypothetical protein
MELTRRDALAALGAAGVAAAGGAALTWESMQETPLGDHEYETLVALAEVVYPSGVDGIPTFVETYVVGRVRDRPDYARGIAESIGTLDTLAADWFGDEVVDLPPDQRDALLREAGLEEAAPDPEGGTSNRMRYYLVNELLFAFYTSPTGGSLVGLENPPGHPGGTESYQHGPRDD